MTGLEMQIEFERLLYTSNPEYSTSQKLDTDEIFAYLNVAQLRVMKAKYFPSANILENVRIIQSNVEDLRNLIKRATPSLGSTIAAYSNYATLVALPADYLHYIRSDSAITRTAVPVISSTSIVPNKVIDYSEVDKVTVNDFNKPILRKPCIVFEESDNIIIFRDSYTTITAVYLTYLSTPNDISLSADCELAEYLHEEVVATAVDIFRREKYLLVTKQEDDNSRNA
ncbi:MAG TPA: hypothetical protein PLG47_04690 [Candidatus Dojkabacteria bacterium]|nr:hypothetical protein [Candidatus Dojkabacteria bacterium]